jgi:phosphate/sulfate permease
VNNHKLKWLLWGGLLLFLVLSYSGWQLRTGIEANNQRLITVADYREMSRSAATANVSMDSVLERLQNNGVRHIGLKETSLRELAFQGDVYLWSFGEFRTFHEANQPQLWNKVLRSMGSHQVSPANLVAVTSQEQVAQFLSTQLESRYQAGQIIHLIEGENHYFIINSAAAVLDKRKEIQPQLDMILGFDPREIEQIKAYGLEIVLRPENSKGTSLEYLQEYEAIVRDYDIKYLVFSNEVSGQPAHLDNISDLVNRYGLMIGVVETPEQLGYVNTPGLDEVLEKTGYPINRLYTSVNDDFVKSIDDRYYRWVRAVVDRGIRILYVSPFKDLKLDAGQNLDNTIDTIGRFHETMQAKGFILNEELPIHPNQTPSPWHRFMVSLSLVFAGSLYLYYLFKWKPLYLYLLLLLGGAFSLFVNLFTGLDLSKLYALGAAILYPTLSSLLLLLYLRDRRHHPLWLKTLYGLLLVVGINLLGGYTVIASLADIRYIMNIKIFSGVKLSFFLPLLLFMLNYFSCFKGEDKLSMAVWKTLQLKPSYLVLFLFAVAAAAGYYYLGRSGNNIVSVSSLELRVREILEMIFPARPRFKEIMIGYPALISGVYLYHKYRQDFILFIWGLAVTVGSISMVNSFCHVFTTASISLQRSLAGILVGAVIGLGVVLGIMLLEWIAKRFFPEILNYDYR